MAKTPQAPPEVLVGLEVHVQLMTKTKLFCSCPNLFGEAPISLTCPICTGQPGSMPSLNAMAVELAVVAATALGCTINQESTFSRKHYYYPDLPKGYQITQYDRPLAVNGSMEYVLDGKPKKARISRVHIEEDAARITHSNGLALVDLNRSGVPLIEIVTTPCFHDGKEVEAFLKWLRRLLRWHRISNCDMEAGSLRVDVNVSVGLPGRKRGPKVEVKNMASFAGAAEAVNFEILRQFLLLNGGSSPVKETRFYDAMTRSTVPMRSKEDEADYRYMDEPDLLPLIVTDKMMSEARECTADGPLSRYWHLIREVGIAHSSAATLASSKRLADYYKDVSGLTGQPHVSLKWVLGEFSSLLARMGNKAWDVMPADTLAKLIEGVVSNKIPLAIARQMFKDISDFGETQAQPSGHPDVEGLCREALEKYPETVKEYRHGKTEALNFLVGAVMRDFRGQLDPVEVKAFMVRLLAGGELDG